MKFSVALSAAALLATAVAMPAPEDHAGRAARRRAARAARKSGLMIKDVDNEEVMSGLVAGNETHAATSYSTNWSGVVITKPPTGETFKTVVGTYTIPKPTAPSGAGSSSSYSASAWVGIDGDTYSAAILQAGTDFTVTKAGAVSYDSWYEWYPAVSHDFASFSTSQGDTVTVTIKATSDSAGEVILENNTTGKSTSKTLSAPTAKSDLGGENAEWIVEDFEEGSSLVALVNFGTVTFTGCSATTDSGTSVGLTATNAGTINIRQSGTVYTDVTIKSASEFVVEYKG